MTPGCAAVAAWQVWRRLVIEFYAVPATKNTVGLETALGVRLPVAKGREELGSCSSSGLATRRTNTCPYKQIMPPGEARKEIIGYIRDRIRPRPSQHIWLSYNKMQCFPALRNAQACETFLVLWMRYPHFSLSLNGYST